MASLLSTRLTALGTSPATCCTRLQTKNSRAYPADIEIDSTARDATEAGLHVTVVSDCCIGSSPDRHEAAIVTTLPRLVHAVLTLEDLARFGVSST